MGGGGEERTGGAGKGGGTSDDGIATFTYNLVDCSLGLVIGAGNKVGRELIILFFPYTIGAGVIGDETINGGGGGSCCCKLTCWTL